MSPPKRRATYRAPRNRREVTVAVLASVTIVVVTALLIWFLRPNKDLGSSTTVTTTVPAVTTTLAPTDTTVAPADSTPATTTPADSTP